MRAFFDIFQLELRALSRSWSLAMLSAASAAWMLAVPRLVVGDGTAEGRRCVHVLHPVMPSPAEEPEHLAAADSERKRVHRHHRRPQPEVAEGLGYAVERNYDFRFHGHSRFKLKWIPKIRKPATAGSAAANASATSPSGIDPPRESDSAR